MLSDFFKSRVRIQALRDGPAGALFEGFGRALSETGYATITARGHLRAAESLVPPRLRSGRFKATDKLIALLTPRSLMRSETASK